MDQMIKQNGSAFQEETEEIETYVETGSTNRKREGKNEDEKSDSRITEETGTSDRALVMPQG